MQDDDRIQQQKRYIEYIEELQKKYIRYIEELRSKNGALHLDLRRREEEVYRVVPGDPRGAQVPHLLEHGEERRGGKEQGPIGRELREHLGHGTLHARVNIQGVHGQKSRIDTCWGRART
jgi:hypothetical protein